MRVVICNGWSDLNSGDSAIIMGIIKRFNIEHESLEIKILSELSNENFYYDKSIEKIIEEFPNISIETIPSPFYKVYDGNLFSKVRELFSVVLVYISFFMGIKNKSFSTIEDSDVVISKGGHFLFDRQGVHGFFHLLKCLYPLKIAKKLNKPYSILAQSMGPFYNSDFFSKKKLEFTLNVLNSAKGISFREEISLEKMIKLGLSESNVNLTSDYAFLLNENKKIKFENKDPYVVITLRQHNFPQKNGELRYLETIKECCDKLHNKYGVTILVIPHVKGPNSFENDNIITKKFEDMTKGINYYNYDYTYYSATELIKLYSEAEILIGTRFHSVIFALISNVPAFAISYSGYKANIVKQFKLDKFMIDIEELAVEHNEKFIELVEELFESKNEAKELIKSQMVCVKKAILNDEAFLKV
ncbi:polysaccharide pyruvyl transferase family protein [Enterococcus sp. JM9B]|uniref:polysaccharide pyruvyl transferase family protein n=1 Tax=Enterococcus sp. JM9B TaxID=1857216 RepID=UPI001374A4C0|nr:polysaccharide pyruvyl transferase family protein [Enterococcus sp. JM9B]KAF1303522.1 hypothetical protein BAU16_04035 [Enterococcus sp. JM9B]